MPQLKETKPDTPTCTCRLMLIVHTIRSHNCEPVKHATSMQTMTRRNMRSGRGLMKCRCRLPLPGSALVIVVTGEREKAGNDSDNE